MFPIEFGSCKASGYPFNLAIQELGENSVNRRRKWPSLRKKKYKPVEAEPLELEEVSPLEPEEPEEPEEPSC